jgi:hypothetical protein
MVHDRLVFLRNCDLRKRLKTLPAELASPAIPIIRNITLRYESTKITHTHLSYRRVSRREVRLGSSIRVSQEERSIFWEVIVSVILSKKSVYVHVSYSELFHSTVPKFLISKRYYIKK